MVGAMLPLDIYRRVLYYLELIGEFIARYAETRILD